MRRLSLVFVCTLVLLASVPVSGTVAASHDDCSFPVTVTDATGTEVTIDAPPERIVTLSPSAAQTLWEIGAKSTVVGTSAYADYLEGTDDIPVVDTGESGVNVEQLIALDPDLVIAPGTISTETVATLRSKGLTVVAFETSTSIEGVAEKTTQIGRLTGHCEGAARTNAWMFQNVENVRSAVADESRPTAMYVFFGYTVGGDTFISGMMDAAGVQNVMASENVTGYGQVSKEVVRERNPEWILLNEDDPKVPDDPAYTETTAYQQNQTVVLDRNYLNQPAPRSIVFAVRNLTAAVHPAAYEEATYVPRSEVTVAHAQSTESTPTADATAADATAADATTDSPAQTARDGPGFGAVTAVGALVLLLFATRRR